MISNNELNVVLNVHVRNFYIDSSFREKKEQEENERLGIKSVEDEDEDIEEMKGGPFRRVDVRELEKKVIKDEVTLSAFRFKISHNSISQILTSVLVFQNNCDSLSDTF